MNADDNAVLQAAAMIVAAQIRQTTQVLGDEDLVRGLVRAISVVRAAESAIKAVPSTSRNATWKALGEKASK